MQNTNRKQYPLLPFSALVSEDIANGKGDAWVFQYNLMAEGIDVNRLRQAIGLVLQHHPVFSSRITDYVQQYEAGYRTPYFACDIREEGTACVLTIRFHRILGDGASLVLLLTNINKVYKGEEIAADTYLEYLESQERLRVSAHYASSRQWTIQRYDSVTAPSCPKPDSDASSSHTHGIEATVLRRNIPMKPDDIGKGELLNLATALAIMDYNGTDSAALTWGYLGRETAAEMTVFGSLSRDVPFVLTRTGDDSAATLKAKARSEVQQGILHSAYPYTFNATNRELWRYAVSVEILPRVDLAIGDTEWQLIPTADEQTKQAHCFLDVEYHEAEEALVLRYSTYYYKEESIERFADLIVGHLGHLQTKPSAPCCRQDAAPADGITFIEKFEENVRQYPGKVVLQDCEMKLTFRELDELSGRVRAYLHKRNIRREQFVMIHLPHGLSAYVCLLGVWRAGAAAVLADTSISEERFSFMFSDCHPVTTIDSAAWNEILNTEPEAGHDETSPNDAAFAVYTSGSEGRPKGVVHEYGKLTFFPANLQRLVGEVCQTHISTERIQYSYLPLSTIGTIAVITMSIWNPMISDIGSVALMKNPKALSQYIKDRRINMAFFPPSFYHLCPTLSDELNLIYFASEPLRYLYQDGRTLLNIYIQSEGYHICGFRLNKEYKNTPVGRPVEDSMVRLLDDDGNVVPAGRSGELCYYNPYFRGYINDEERTRQSFVGEYFRSGDIARINEDGNYVILGRKTDMIKINGNRIEPAEIEAAVKRVLGIDWAFAKGFVQPDRSFICVYYTADIDIDLTAVREELLRILPNYMIPSYFIHIDDVPRLPNGKIDRQAFKVPDIEEFHAEYAAPANELEERLCALMQRILQVESIGIDDDFFLLGGDSLRTIRLATECNIAGITVNDIYAARTPRAIAERWMLKQVE